MNLPRNLAAPFAVLVIAALTMAVLSAADQAYRASIEKWRQEREDRLKAEDGWLTVAGLFWLKEGDNRFGADPLNDIVFPASPGVPGEIGVFEFRGGKTKVRIKKGVTVTMNGKPVEEAELRPDSPDILALGDLTFFVHASGERLGIRLKDKNSRLRREFTGCKWFPINEAFRIEGRLIPYDSPKTVQVPNILGDVETFKSPGLVAFTISGQQMRMEAVSSGPNRLWFIFRDLTSGRETYPAARFLYADAPGPDGKVILDFNQATNPPCAFNPFTTCPLPPEQNRLRVRVEAGEMNYHTTTESAAAGRGE